MPRDQDWDAGESADDRGGMVLIGILLCSLVAFAMGIVTGAMLA